MAVALNLVMRCAWVLSISPGALGLRASFSPIKSGLNQRLQPLAGSTCARPRRGSAEIALNFWISKISRVHTVYCTATEVLAHLILVRSKIPSETLIAITQSPRSLPLLVLSLRRAAGVHLQQDVLVFVLGLTELTRRCMFNVFRLEFEQYHNTGLLKFKAERGGDTNEEGRA